jgi:hypothetical protein
MCTLSFKMPNGRTLEIRASDARAFRNKCRAAERQARKLLCLGTNPDKSAA